MKSISIVYKRSKAIKQQIHQNVEDNGIRRTANDFYTKLLQKQINHEQLIQRIRSQTARATKLKQRKNVVSSLSINSISTPQPQSNLKKSNTQKKIASQITFNVKKPKLKDYFTLKLPEHNNQRHQAQFTVKRNTKQFIKHSKMKLLSKIKCEKQVTLILSIDFIYNQYNFWGQQTIQDSCFWTWKLLQPLANILWIVRSEETYRKLTIFSQNKGLRLDGVLQIQINKKQPLTISYSNLEQQVKFHRGHKILIINSLKNDNISQIGQLQFRSSLPIISHPLTFVHFIRIDMKNKNRLNQVKKVVSQQLPKPFNLQHIFQMYRQKKGRYISKINIRSNFLQSLSQSDIPTLSQKMQKMKSNLLVYFDQSFGLKTKFQGGQSLSYIIGDIIKRNYNIAKKFYQRCSQIQQKQADTANFLQSTINNKIQRFCYNRHVYVWQF